MIKRLTHNTKSYIDRYFERKYDNLRKYHQKRPHVPQMSLARIFGMNPNEVSRQLNKKKKAK